jgi:hypothetical protein
LLFTNALGEPVLQSPTLWGDHPRDEPTALDGIIACREKNMKNRDWYWRIAGLAAVCPVALTLALALGSADSQAGIVREVPGKVVPPVQPPASSPASAPASDPASAPANAPATAPADSPGIFRQVLAKVGIGKPPPSGAAGSQTLPRQGFACCNLHYDGDWISDGNYAELPMIPAGTPIEVLSYGRHRASVKVDGKPMRLGHDYGRGQESLETWVGKIVVNDDPRPRIAAYPPAIREAIHEGKVTPGMTREQAVVAIGYPLTNENASLDAAVWRIWRSRRGEYQLNFRPDGHLASVSGDDEVTSAMIYRAGK